MSEDRAEKSGHTDTTWPESLATVTRAFAQVSDRDKRSILVDNCVALSRLLRTLIREGRRTPNVSLPVQEMYVQ